MCAQRVRLDQRSRMVIFLYGPNSYERQRQVDTMTAAYVKKTGSDLGLERIDGETATVQQLMSSLAAVPFLATSRLVIVEGAAANKTIGAKWTDILAAVPKSTVAVFVEREVDQRTAAFKALKTAEKVMKFEPLSPAKLPAWVKSQVAERGGSIEAAAVRELIDRAGDDQWRLGQEIGKLVAYAPEITVAAVEELVAATIQRTIFDLVEAMTAGRAAVALTAYQALLAQKESEIYILTMIQWQLRNLLMAKLAPAAMSPTEAATASGVSPYVMSKAVAAAARVDEAKLRAAFAAAVEAEYQIKSGAVRGEVAVERLIIQIAASLGA